MPPPPFSVQAATQYTCEAEYILRQKQNNVAL